MSKHASQLMLRHGYVIDTSGGGPHSNVLGHPLFHLVHWVDEATGQGVVAPEVLQDLCASSLFGYLSVRAEDDFFDGDTTEADVAMMTSTVFRSRHHSLLAIHISDPRFWERFELVWQLYAEAMMLEKSLHDPASNFGDREFEAVLGRSQPLEIPAAAVLALKHRWDLQPTLTELVRHLTRATQLLDDFVDAPTDLAAGNYTLMVRRLGGMEGESQMRLAMVTSCDAIMAEVGDELELAISLAEDLGIEGLNPWAEERKRVIARASTNMFSALFDELNRS